MGNIRGESERERIIEKNRACTCITMTAIALGDFIVVLYIFVFTYKNHDKRGEGWLDNDLQYQYIQGLYTGIIGKGEAIIFVHGGPGGDHRFFLPHMLPLSEQYRLILYDQRGCGMSDASSNGQYTMKDEVEALEMLRKDLQLDKVNLFGESWGSMLALMYACAYPDRINKILLTAAIGLNVDGYHLFEKE